MRWKEKFSIQKETYLDESKYAQRNDEKALAAEIVLLSKFKDQYTINEKSDVYDTDYISKKKSLIDLLGLLLVYFEGKEGVLLPRNLICEFIFFW